MPKKKLSPIDLERVFLGLMSRLMLRLNGDADHDDEMVRDFCCRLDLRRETPEAGAVCPNWARTDLCGGREVTRVPTAKVIGAQSE